MNKKVKDLIGKKFCKLTIIKETDDYIRPNGIRIPQYLCRCDCGNEVIAREDNIISGRAKSCGCYNGENLSGQRFGRLKVVCCVEDKVYPSGVRVVQWLCRCDCGNECIAKTRDLKNMNKKSCGCLQNKKTKSRERARHIWYNMKDRCLNEKHERYNSYGGRGIKVCDEWLEFESFYEWSIENGYNDTLTIDRIDVNGNYEPNNCRWVDMKTQQNNTRRNHYITYNGKTQTLSQWAEEFNINYYTLLYRINRGWSIEKAFKK